MSKATKICKVCGKEYEYCHTQRKVPGVFRYQDVACCPEHGSIYLSRVIASRTDSTQETETDTSVDEEFSSVHEEDIDDEWFAEDFSDEDDEEID